MPPCTWSDSRSPARKSDSYDVAPAVQKLRLIMNDARYAGLWMLVFAGCAARTQGARPHDMSVAGHETSASREELTAAEHEGRYDPAAAQRRERCRGGRTAAADIDPCWTQVTNPTAEHLKHAEEFRARAADHRAASQALREAEARACAGVPEADRDESPFDRREDIEGIEKLYVTQGGKQPTRRLEGAVVEFRAVPGLTSQWLQRVVDCHLARNAALGHEVPEMLSCPLVPKGARATVVPTQRGFAVEIRGADTEAAAEIARRAEMLSRR